MDKIQQWLEIYIYIYETLLSKATYSAFRLYMFLSVHVFPGNRTHDLCTANAMLYHWATGTNIIFGCEKTGSFIYGLVFVLILYCSVQVLLSI